jgi:pimeloyl-ACP methyl ester carboxylesterase
MLALATLCAFIAVSALFYRGQWQLVLHPSRIVTTTPASLSLAFTEVHFGVDASGQPQLDGWWIPSDSPADPTALILHSGTGSISDALPDARLLHDANLNVLLFDYRGYGRSGGQHPSQALMEGDANSALRYLTDIRSIPASTIIVFGRDLGASLATTLCTQHKELPALILESPDGDVLARVRQDPRSHMVPVGLLFHNTFPLTTNLDSLTTPKLIITSEAANPTHNWQSAADPKTTVELPTPIDPAQIHKAVHRFIDTYISHPPQLLLPHP